MKSKAVFLDRDGILVKVLFKGDWLSTCLRKEDAEVLPGVKESLNALKSAGYLLLVVTNQPNVNRGDMTTDDVNQVHDRLINEYQLPVDKFYFCPHEGSEDCECKKPLAGMIIDQAMRDYPDIDLQESFVIGDRGGDMEMGKAVGVKTILVPSPATLWFTTKKPESDYRVENLSQAVDIILGK